MESKIGTLWKEESGLVSSSTSWRRRCVILDGAAVYVFRKAPDLTPQGIIQVQGVQLKQEANSILLTAHSQLLLLRLGAESEEDTADWVRAIGIAATTPVESNGSSSAVKMGFLYLKASRVASATGANQNLGKWYVGHGILEGVGRLVGR